MKARATPVDAERVRGLLLRNWMTHDAMWFMHAVQQLGIDRANALNRAAVRSMAAVEARRILRLLGMERVDSYDDLLRFFEGAIALVIPDFMQFSWSASSDGRTLRFEITRCFAHEGVSALGVVDRYECGIYERIYGWLDALGAAYEVSPAGVHCTLHHDGDCRRAVSVTLPGSVQSPPSGP